MKKVKVGLVGISGYSGVHFSHLKPLVEKGVIELVCSAVINQAQVPEKVQMLKDMGVKVYSSTAEMFEHHSGELDLVCVPVGIAWHERIAVEAVKHGANVLVEKPVTSSNESLARMKQAEKETGKFIAVGFQHIYAREIQFIKHYLISGRLGKIKKVVCSGVWPRNDGYFARNNWAGKLYTEDGVPIWDSPINNAFAHYLNIELFLAGEDYGKSAHVVKVEGDLFRAREDIETFDTCTLRFTTDTGIPIVTMLTHASDQASDVKVRVECENGTALWDASAWQITTANGKVVSFGIPELSQPEMFMDVINKINGKKDIFYCSLDIAAEHTNCVDMLTNQLTPIVVKENVSRKADNGQYVMENINAVFAECDKTGKLPSEMGVTWK